MSAVAPEGTVKNHMSTVETSLVDATLIDTVSIPGVVTATLAGFTGTGAPVVDIPGHSRRTHTAARSCVPLHSIDVGKQVVIVPDAQNPDSPIVVGVVHTPTSRTVVDIIADGHGVTICAAESIILKCGEASITLNRDGKVVIRGKHVVTHASGVNRIRGGSVQLN
jgi:hypothetical protein